MSAPILAPVKSAALKSKRLSRAMIRAPENFAAGLLVAQLGGLSNATGIMTCFALLSLLAVMLGRETRGEQLPR